ncbi:MAG TPA: hypothetical protein PLJ44_05440 [Victivallales bacterium]|nr:hypothetical protein [Victivallales bacterium]
MNWFSRVAILSVATMVPVIFTVPLSASPSVTLEPAVVKVGDKITVTIESDGWILKGGPIVKGPAEGSLTSTGGTLTATGPGYVIVSTYWVHPNGNGGEEEMSATGTAKVTIDVESIDVWDSNERHASENILQIVAPKMGEDINGSVKNAEALPSASATWSYNGIEKLGANVTFKKGAAGWESGEKILKNVAPKSSDITCEDKNVTILVYPYDVSVISVNIGTFSGIANSIAEALLVLVPQDITIEVPEVVIDVDNQWKEQKNTNFCGWTYSSDIAIDPMYSVEATIGVPAKKLKKLDELLDKALLGKYLKKYVISYDVPKLSASVKNTPSLKAKFSRDEYGKLNDITKDFVHNGGDVDLSGGGKITFQILPQFEDIITVDARSEFKAGWISSLTPWIKEESFGIDATLTLKPCVVETVAYINLFGNEFKPEIEPLTLYKGKDFKSNNLFKYNFK